MGAYFQTSGALSSERCKYCVAKGETLLTKMRLFMPDMNWLRLWAVNAADDGDERTLTLDDPDLLSSEAETRLISLGLLYKSRTGDTLQDVAERMRTTVRSLLLLNPDLEVLLLQKKYEEKGNEEISAGTELCVLPCSLGF